MRKTILLVAVLCTMSSLTAGAKNGDPVTELKLKPFTGRNIIPDGSFELGFDCGWSGDIRWKHYGFNAEKVYNPTHIPRADSSTAAKGKQSLRLSVPKYGWAYISSPKLTVKAGQNYTISFYLKSDQDPLPVDIGLGRGKFGRDKKISKEVIVGRKWKRYSLTGKPGKSAHYVRLDVFGGGRKKYTGPCTLWVDGVQMEKGKLTEYSADTPVEVGFQVKDVSMLKKKRVYNKGDKVSLSVKFIRHDPKVTNLKVDYAVLDYLQDKRSFPAENINLNGTSKVKKQFLLPSDKYGTFKLRVAFDGGTATSKGVREFIYAVIPKQKNINFCKDSPFACKVAIGSQKIDLLKRIGVKWVQIFHTLLWTCVEQERGKYTWNDYLVKKYNKNGFCILGELCEVPGWAVGKPDAPKNLFTKFYPKTFKDWNNYIAKIVVRYKDEIQAWNVWNEPYLSPHSTLTIGTEPPVPGRVGHPDYYAKMLKTSYQTIKRVNPGATVLGSCIYPGYKKYLEAVLKNDVLDYMDVLPIHDYTFIPPENVSGGTKARIKKLSDLMAKYGKVKPIWNTEFIYGWRSNYRDRNLNPRSWHAWPHTTSPIRAASRNVRLYLSSLAAGVKKIFIFTIGNFFEYDNAPSDMLSSYAAMTHILSETPKFISRVDLADGVYGVVFQRSDGKFVAALWTIPSRIELSFTLSSNAMFLDIMGNELSKLKKGAKCSVKLDYMPRYLLGDWKDGASAVKDITGAVLSGVQPLTISSAVLNDRNCGLALGIKAVCAIPSSKNNLLHIKKYPAGVKFKSKFIRIKQLLRGKPKQITIPIKSVRATGVSTTLKGTLTTEKNGRHPISIPFSLLTAARSTKKKVVDGNSMDWEDAQWIKIKNPEQVRVGYTKPTIDVTDTSCPILPYWHGAKDLSAKVAGAWDSENLYFIFDVTDDKVNFYQATHNSDAIELFLDFDKFRNMKKTHYSNKTWQIMFSPGSKGKLKANYRVMKPLGKKLQGMKMVSRKTAKGYILEVAIPLANFNGFIFKAGQTIAFDIALDDRDNEKKRKTQMIWAGDKHNWEMPTNFGSLLLIKK